MLTINDFNIGNWSDDFKTTVDHGLEHLFRGRYQVAQRFFSVAKKKLSNERAANSNKTFLTANSFCILLFKISGKLINPDKPFYNRATISLKCEKNQLQHINILLEKLKSNSNQQTQNIVKCLEGFKELLSNQVSRPKKRSRNGNEFFKQSSRPSKVRRTLEFKVPPPIPTLPKLSVRINLTPQQINLISECYLMAPSIGKIPEDNSPETKNHLYLYQPVANELKYMLHTKDNKRYRGDFSSLFKNADKNRAALLTSIIQQTQKDQDKLDKISMNLNPDRLYKITENIKNQLAAVIIQHHQQFVLRLLDPEETPDMSQPSTQGQLCIHTNNKQILYTLHSYDGKKYQGDFHELAQSFLKDEAIQKLESNIQNHKLAFFKDKIRTSLLETFVPAIIQPSKIPMALPSGSSPKPPPQNQKENHHEPTGQTVLNAMKELLVSHLQPLDLPTNQNNDDFIKGFSTAIIGYFEDSHNNQSANAELWRDVAKMLLPRLGASSILKDNAFQSAFVDKYISALKMSGFKEALQALKKREQLTVQKPTIDDNKDTYTSKEEKIASCLEMLDKYPTTNDFILDIRIDLDCFLENKMTNNDLQDKFAIAVSMLELSGLSQQQQDDFKDDISSMTTILFSADVVQTNYYKR